MFYHFKEIKPTNGVFLRMRQTLQFWCLLCITGSLVVL